MAGLIDFSVDPISNDLGAPPINFQEGQPAGTVNNSAREVMAALARWRDDNAGAYALRGTGDAYAISTNQGFGAGTTDNPGPLTRLHTIAFTVDSANQGPSTLSLDGGPAKPILRTFGGQLGPGDLTPAVVFHATFIPALAAYVIVAPTIARPGKIDIQAMASAASGWVPCDGRLLSRTSYAALFAAIGTTYGSGDGSTTFAVPSFNGGRAPMGPGLTGAGGINGTLGSSGGTETVTLTEAQMPSHGHDGSTAAAGGHDHGGSVAAAGSHNHGGGTVAAGAHTHGASTAQAGAHQHSGTTDAGGQHSHGLQYTRTANYNSGGGLYAASDMFPTPGSNSGGQTDVSGTHAHPFTTGSAGDHSHGVTVNGVGDHAHAIGSDGTHAHGINAVGDHAHGLTIAPTGGGAAHPNMPPGLVVAFVIKA